MDFNSERKGYVYGLVPVSASPSHIVSVTGHLHFHRILERSHGRVVGSIKGRKFIIHKEPL